MSETATPDRGYIAPAVKVDGPPQLLHLARFGEGQVPGRSVSFCGRMVERERGYHSPLPFCPICTEAVDGQTPDLLP